jgi:molybdopterin/thiamine biosynthesis adenylyltransferase
LDNIQARIFIDDKCVASRTPLIDSGTLGPKGHVQIIVPHLKTESYNSQRDPDEAGGEIPQCTLKMFPEETLHCVEWAKSMFGDLFTLKPQSFNKLVVLEKDRSVNLSD